MWSGQFFLFVWSRDCCPIGANSYLQSAARISIGFEANIPKKDITPCEGPKKGSYVSCVILFKVTSVLEICEEATEILLYSVADDT